MLSGSAALHAAFGKIGPAVGLPWRLRCSASFTASLPMIDLEVRREVSLCLVPIGRTSETSLPEPIEAPALGLETIPSSALAGESYRLQLIAEEEQANDLIEDVILRRGSTRTFDRTASIAETQLSVILVSVSCQSRAGKWHFSRKKGTVISRAAHRD